MIVFLNGDWVAEEQARVSVFDRGFLYGDGLFETLRVRHGRPFGWEAHCARLEQGAEYLRLRLPWSREALRAWAGELIQRNGMPEALLRLTVSRGVGRRGYSPRGADQPTLVMTLHPPPVATAEAPAWKLVTASCRLPAGEPLARFKTSNKLAQVVARAEADEAGADEALLLNTDGRVAEATSANVFWVQGGRAGTPPAASGILAGVTRRVLLDLCRQLKLECVEQDIAPEALAGAAGVFLSLSTVGVAEVVELDGRKLARSPWTNQLYRAYQELVERECKAQEPVSESVSRWTEAV